MAQKSENTNSNTSAIIFAVFAVVCIVAFLSFRGGDVGQLPKLVGNLGGGPLFGNAVVEFAYGVAASILILFSWFSAGTLICQFLGVTSEFENSPSRTLTCGFAAGAAFWSIIWWFLGILGLYSAYAAVVCVVAAIFNGCYVFLVVPLKWPKLITGSKLPLLGLIVLPVLLALISALAPPTAKDALLYHFAVPRAFVAQHSNAFIDGNIASYLALGTEMQSVWAMLLGNIFSPRAGEAAAGVTTFLFFPLLLLAIYGWARELNISRNLALIATAIAATVPSAYHVASSGYIDLSLALYVTLATYGLTRWWKEQTWGWVILIGIFLGAALSIKLTAVFVFAAFALIVLLRARGAENAGKIVGLGFAALLLAGVIASPWYIRTWVATGSPVFPFYMSIWPGKANGWDVERSNLFQGMNSQYGGADTNKLNYLTAPARVSIMAQPEQPANYDGVLGVAFLIGLPLLVWALWKFDLAVEIKIMSGVAAIVYLFWLFSSEQLRYLLPIVPLLAIAIAASVETIGGKKGSLKTVAQYAFIAAAVCGTLTTVAWFCQRAPLRVVLGGETRDQYLTRNLDYYPYYQAVNNDTAPDARIWLINMRRDTYNIDRPVFSDYLFEDWTLRKMLWESRSVQELRAKTAAMGIKYVLTRHDFLFDFDRSTLVDEKLTRAENEAKLKIAREFILDPTNTIRSDTKFSLVKLF
ncbi:MAG: glycosyltransferase family 39 protein [Chloracidobacterium sp.]|nr:glycosyltransferase family 39 protein [Chloracidobacterium sp.]